MWVFGWGRPVETVPTSYTRRFSMRAGLAIVSFAGPFANFVMAVLCAGLWVGLNAFSVLPPDSPFYPLLTRMVTLNLTLFFFNLLPVPPLDGSKIVAWMFGYKADKPLDWIASFGMMGLIVAVVVAGSAIGWAVQVLSIILLTGFSTVLS